MRRTHVLIGAIAVSLVLGCRGDVTAPLAGDKYILESIAGVALPAPYFNGPNDPYRIVADTIALQGGGGGLRRTVYEKGTPSDREAVETDFSYTLQGASIAIYFSCPPNADCIAGPHLSGTMTDATLNITNALGGLVPLAYRRRFPPD